MDFKFVRDLMNMAFKVFKEKKICYGRPQLIVVTSKSSKKVMGHSNST